MWKTKVYIMWINVEKEMFLMRNAECYPMRSDELGMRNYMFFFVDFVKSIKVLTCYARQVLIAINKFHHSSLLIPNFSLKKIPNS